MAAQKVQFRATCPYEGCGAPMHITCKEVRPDAEGEGELTVTCIICNRESEIKVPAKYLEKDK